jgi:peptidoglycan hydrolase-like protein with peptidoglycan-binding domain
MRRRLAIAAAVAVALAAVGVVVTGAATGFGGRPAAGPALVAQAPATAEVTRQTLVDYRSVTGTLGYGEQTAVVSKATGVLTWLPAAGSVVERGQPLYRADEVAVPLLYGELPLYRALAPGVTGADVRQLERNLRELGYTGFDADDRYTAGTAAAVRRWQAGLGLAKTGTLEPGQALYRPGPVRVASPRKRVGDDAAGELYTVTGTRRLVTAELVASARRYAPPGAAVTVELPGGATATGSVAGVAPAGSGSSSGAGSSGGGSSGDRPAGPGGGSDGGAKITVTIGLDESLPAGRYSLDELDQAAVTVRLAAEQRAGVLAVPVEALLALPGGGYGVQVVDGATSRVVPVETGLFAAGRVEVRAAGLAERMLVGVPR